MNQNNIKNVIIYYETSIHIPLNCKHKICYNCYYSVNKFFIDVVNFYYSNIY